jgi:hypothetical protein
MAKIKGNVQIEETGVSLEDLIIRTQCNNPSSASDLNNLYETGLYYLPGNSEAVNHPSAGLAGWLIVLNYNGGSRVKQIWTRFTGGGGVCQTWMRVGEHAGTSSETWYSWLQAI